MGRRWDSARVELVSLFPFLKERSDMNLVKASILGIALLGATTAVSSASIVAEFELNDHPGGDQAPPTYGLRLDNILGPGVATLSMDFYDDTRMVVSEDAGVISLHITGTLYGGEVEAHDYVDAHSYAVDFLYEVNVSDAGNGWNVNTFDTANTGTVTDLDTSDVFTLYGMANMDGLVFSMLADGFRLNGDNSSWVGRGWLTANSDGTVSNAGAQDWLFVGTPVPSPAGAFVLGLGGLVSMRRRR